jgi:beta-glucosidase
VSYFYAGDSSLISRLSAWTTHRFANEYFINLVKRRQDYFGLNYYFANRFIGTRVHNPEGAKNDLGWSMQPDMLRPFLSVIFKKYKLPILITESGVADRKDINRKWWIAESIKAIDGAQKDGVEMLGYIHWSLLDNFEWAEGFWPRFGLVEVDYKTQKRTVRASAKWYAQVIHKLREQQDE